MLSPALPEWQHPVTVAVTPNNIKQWEEFALNESSGPDPEHWKISLDVMLYAFLEEMWTRLPREGGSIVQLGF
jgi:hypothetical protein